MLGTTAFAGLEVTDRVIEFGCEYGEDLLNLSEQYGVSGVAVL